MSSAHVFALGLALAISGCTSGATAPAIETISIQAVGETIPVQSPGDAADDPAIWRNPADPTQSLIVVTDKEWGLNVYDLSGALRASAPAGLVNNVDLRADVLINGQQGVLVAASDRTNGRDGRIALYALETSPVALRHLAHAGVEGDGVGSVYGFCLWRRAADEVFAFIAYNNGDVRQYALDFSSATPTATLVRSVKLSSRTEGCVVDERTGVVYVGEEEVGVWRMDAAPDSVTPPFLFAPVDGMRLVADVEGLAIVPVGASGGYLIASSQADGAHDASESAFAVYALEDARFVGQFRVVGSGEVDGVTDTDRLEFAPGDFGAPFDEGLFVVQDGDNAPDHQNFKLIPGRSILNLLPR